MDHMLYRLAVLFELILIIVLTTFGCAHHNAYRAILWQVGGVMGYSDSRERVYYYANYREPPPVPLVWDEA